MAATRTAAAAATGKFLLLLLLGLSAPAAALAGYIEVGTGRAPEPFLLRPPSECGLRVRAMGAGRGARGGGGGPALRRFWRASRARPCLAQCLALEVGLPLPPQRPNERHRGCGGRRAALASPAPIPPAALPHPLGTPRGLDPSPALPRDHASLCRAPRGGPQPRTQCGWTRSGRGRADPNPGWSRQCAPRAVLGFPTGKRWMRPLLARWAERRRCGRLGSAAVPRRAPLGLHRSRLLSPAAGVPSASVCPSTQILRPGIGPSGEIVKYSCLPASNKQGDPHPPLLLVLLPYVVGFGE